MHEGNTNTHATLRNFLLFGEKKKNLEARAIYLWYFFYFRTNYFLNIYLKKNSLDLAIFLIGIVTISFNFMNGRLRSLNFLRLSLTGGHTQDT